MNTEIFHSAFFGYENLPDSIELENRKLIPIKALKLRYEKNCMRSDHFGATCIRQICKIVGIQVHRPVKGLYCIEENDCKFFDYLHQLKDRCWYQRDYIHQYQNFLIS